MSAPKQMTQRAPFPHALVNVVAGLRYRPGWTARLEADLIRDRVDPADDTSEPTSQGMTLVIRTQGYDSYNPQLGETYRVLHFFPVPPAVYVEEDWRRWLFDRFLEVERHEACEFFAIDGERPYAPNHGPGHDPYIVHDPSTDKQRRTSFRGQISGEVPA